MPKELSVEFWAEAGYQVNTASSPFWINLNIGRLFGLLRILVGRSGTACSQTGDRRRPHARRSGAGGERLPLAPLMPDKRLGLTGLRLSEDQGSFTSDTFEGGVLARHR